MFQVLKKIIFYIVFLSVTNFLVAHEKENFKTLPEQTIVLPKLDILSASVDEIRNHAVGIFTNIGQNLDQLFCELKNNSDFSDLMQKIKNDVSAYFDFSMQLSIFDLPGKSNLKDFENWMTEKEFAESCQSEAAKTCKKYNKILFKLIDFIFIESSDVITFFERLNEYGQVIKKIAQNNLNSSPYAKVLAAFNSDFSINIPEESLEEVDAFFIKTLKYRKDFVVWFKALIVLSYENVRLPISDLERAKKIVEDRVFIAKQLLPEIESLIAKWSQE